MRLFKNGMRRLVATMVGGFLSAPLLAAPITVNLPGTKAYDGWDNLTVSKYPGYGAFPGMGMWPAIVSNISGPGDAALAKTANGASGGPYVGGQSIYFGGMSYTPNLYGGSLAVTDSTLVENLANVVFQIEIGEVWGYDFHDGSLPELSYNGGSQNLTATASSRIFRVEDGAFGEDPIYRNTYLQQWDLSGITEDITSISIGFSGVQHAQIYSLRLDQSDTYVAVPEPASLGLLAGGAMMLLARRRSCRR